MPSKKRKDPGPFGQYLRAARDARGLSRQDVANGSGLSYAYLSQLESGDKRTPSVKALMQLAYGVGVPLEELAREAGVDVAPDLLRSRTSAAPADELSWFSNPSHEARTDAGIGTSLETELARARTEVFPALRRLLDGYSPTTQLALLAELQSLAVSDLTRGPSS